MDFNERARENLAIALKELSSFSSLEESHRAWVCSILLRNRYSGQLLSAFLTKPESVPLRSAKRIYISLLFQVSGLSAYEFVSSEKKRLNREVNTLFCSDLRSLPEWGIDSIIRLSVLLESIGSYEEAKNLVLRTYHRFNWLPETLKERYRGFVLLQKYLPKKKNRKLGLKMAA